MQKLKPRKEIERDPNLIVPIAFDDIYDIEGEKIEKE